MRILHVAEPTSGGVWTYVRELRREQLVAGHDVRVVAPRNPGETWPVIEVRQLKRSANPWKILIASRRIASEVASWEPDVIHVHSTFAGVLVRCRRWHRIAVVFQPHSWSWNAAGRGAQVARMLERGLRNRTDCFVLVSQDELAEGLSTIGSRPAVVASIGVDLEYFRPPSQKEYASARKEVGLEESESLLICVGRVCHQKGQDRLVAAWLAANATEPTGVTLAFIGEAEGGYADRVRASARGTKITFVGSVGDVRTWMWASDALIQPSRWEGLSVAVAEGLAAGRSVYATNCQGMRAAIEDRIPPSIEPGGVVAPFSELLGLVQLAIENVRTPLASLRYSPRERAEALFSWKVVAEGVQRSYLLAGCRSDSVSPDV